MKDMVTSEPKTRTELRRALNSRQKRIDKKRLPAKLSSSATSEQIVAALNKILEALNV
jgi:hypothetical protein